MLNIGDETPYGHIVAVLWTGERYYMILDDQGTVSLMPAVAVEPTEKRNE